jgi:hypothetical protein
MNFEKHHEFEMSYKAMREFVAPYLQKLFSKKQNADEKAQLMADYELAETDIPLKFFESESFGLCKYFGDILKELFKRQHPGSVASIVKNHS